MAFDLAAAWNGFVSQAQTQLGVSGIDPKTGDATSVGQAAAQQVGQALQSWAGNVSNTMSSGNQNPSTAAVLESSIPIADQSFAGVNVKYLAIGAAALLALYFIAKKVK